MSVINARRFWNNVTMTGKRESEDEPEAVISPENDLEVLAQLVRDKSNAKVRAEASFLLAERQKTEAYAEYDEAVTAFNDEIRNRGIPRQ